QQAMAALAALVQHARFVQADAAETRLGASGDVKLPQGQTPTLSEFDSLTLLAQNGVSVVVHQLCKDVRSAIRAWREYGVPVVLIACSAALPHKSEHGLVALGLYTEQAIHDAVGAQLAILNKLNVQFDGWIVAPMRKGLQEMM